MKTRANTGFAYRADSPMDVKPSLPELLRAVRLREHYARKRTGLDPCLSAGCPICDLVKELTNMSSPNTSGPATPVAPNPNPMPQPQRPGTGTRITRSPNPGPQNPLGPRGR
jgi:hypothetical protein